MTQKMKKQSLSLLPFCVIPRVLRAFPFGFVKSDFFTEVH
jgi:hypothetical protein